MDQIKESFKKVKSDIDLLRQDINFLKIGLTENREKMIQMCNILKDLTSKIQNFNKKTLLDNSTQNIQIPTVSTNTSTHKRPLESLKHQNISISTGNQGVPTDRQTDKQTNRHIHLEPQIKEDSSILSISEKIDENSKKNLNISIDNAAEILDSLDSVKKEIRLKFKRLTDQEFLVFSTLYQFDEERGYTDYKTLSDKLNLTESSIRDYMGRLIKKGIPVDKKKINNKNIQLSISKNLKKIASLSTILQLRDI